MRKKKILFVSEASWLSTGYSVYTKEILSRLCQVDEFEVAELACFVEQNDTKADQLPWKVYVNKPPVGHPGMDAYKSNPVAQFGDQSFNAVLLDFRPDIVMDIRDWWMMEFEQRSPFRDFFHWAIMPTVDAEPQNGQWINTYDSADSVFAYSEFGRDTMLRQCNSINFIDVASPAANKTFRPVINKDLHKDKMGLRSDSTIIGTVMRNQRRKLYPDLFWSFRQLLDQTNDPNLYLYIHTYYPDVGWEIPELIIQNNLSNRVLLTYKCKTCNNVTIDFFQNSVYGCPRCRKCTNQLVGLNNSTTEQELSDIYNVFDIYVQWSNSEGFGMPQLEAAFCGLPLISMNYSAMESVVKNVGGIPIDPIEYIVECETGCKRAVPNNNQLVEELKKLLTSDRAAIGEKIRNTATDVYSWDTTADKWYKHFKTIPLRDHGETWLSPPQIRQPEAGGIPESVTTVLDATNYIFNNVLCKPEWIGNHIWRRMLKDLTFGYRCESSTNDFYFNESHVKTHFSNERFSAKDAFNDMLVFRNQINEWEQARLEMNHRTQR